MTLKSTVLLSMGLALGSLPAHAITSEEFVADQIVQNSNASTEMSLSETVALYKKRLALMNKSMDQSKINKRGIMAAYLNYSTVEIVNQTGGSGFIYNIIMSYQNDVIQQFKAGQYEAARASVNTTFGTVLNYL